MGISSKVLEVVRWATFIHFDSDIQSSGKLAVDFNSLSLCTSVTPSKVLEVGQIGTPCSLSTLERNWDSPWNPLGR